MNQYTSFVYGIVGNQWENPITPPKQLTKESFQQLKNLRLNRDQQSATIYMLFETEDVITKTILERKRDSSGRAGFVNYTYIMKTIDFFKKHPEAIEQAFNGI